jgi:hypothetical protein
MIDKNGTELVLGDSVIDVHGNVGTLTNVSGVEAIRFEYDGKEKFVFPQKIVPSEIEKR